MVFRLTNKLFKRIKENPPSEFYEEPNPFLDWAADHFTLGGYRFIIITNCASVLSWVYPAKGVNDPSNFAKFSIEEMKECMQVYGFDIQWERIIVPSLDEIHFRKVGDRKLTGILMDLVKHAKFYLSYDDELSTYELSLKLNKIPQCSREESFPIEAFQKLSPR